MRLRTIPPAALVLGALAVGLGAPWTSASQTAPPQQAAPTFKSSTSMVLVRFHVGKKNRYVTGLTRDDVVLLEDGVERPFELLEGGGSQERQIPIEMSIVVDTSGSVVDQGLLDPMVYTATLLEALPGVSLSVYGFAKDARRYCGFTRDPAVLAEAFSKVRGSRDGGGTGGTRVPSVLPPGRTTSYGASWVYESVLAAARDAAATPGPVTRLLTVFSDGQTTTSTRPADVVPDLTALGVSVFPVALGHRQIVEDMRAVQESGYDARGQLTPGARGRMLNLEDRDRRVREFASLAALTGGRSFDPPDVSLGTVRTILAMLTATVVAEYVVGFVPVASGGAPRAHKLEIRLRSKESGSVIGGKRTAVY